MKVWYGLLSLAVIAAIIAGVFVLENTHQAKSKVDQEPSTMQPQSNQNSSELQSTEEVVGTGTDAVAGKTVSVLYTGTLTNGTKFDSTADHGNQPFEFVLGAGKVIKGWDQGVVGMKVGGKRKLVIPPSLGYGSQSVGTIPANSTLVFEIELMEVK